MDVNIFTVTGAILLGGSVVGLVLVSAKWGIKPTLDAKFGRRRKRALERIEQNKEFIGSDQTSELLLKRSNLGGLSGTGSLLNRDKSDLLDHVENLDDFLNQMGLGAMTGSLQSTVTGKLAGVSDAKTAPLPVTPSPSQSVDVLVASATAGLNFQGLETDVYEETGILGSDMDSEDLLEETGVLYEEGEEPVVVDLPTFSSTPRVSTVPFEVLYAYDNIELD